MGCYFAMLVIGTPCILIDKILLCCNPGARITSNEPFDPEKRVVTTPLE